MLINHDNPYKLLDEKKVTQKFFIDKQKLLKAFKRSLELWNYNVFTETKNDWKEEISKSLENEGIKIDFKVKKKNVSRDIKHLFVILNTGQQLILPDKSLLYNIYNFKCKVSFDETNSIFFIQSDEILNININTNENTLREIINMLIYFVQLVNDVLNIKLCFLIKVYENNIKCILVSHLLTAKLKKWFYFILTFFSYVYVQIHNLNPIILDIDSFYINLINDDIKKDFYIVPENNKGKKCKVKEIIFIRNIINYTDELKLYLSQYVNNFRYKKKLSLIITDTDEIIRTNYNIHNYSYLLEIIKNNNNSSIYNKFKNLFAKDLIELYYN